MRLTVLGATGGTGRQLVRQALDAGHEVTAVVRDPARLAVPPEGAGALEVVTADVTDAGALRPAVAGRDAVLSALGANGVKQARSTAIASRGTRAALAAMEATGVRRLVVVSAAPVGPVPEGENLTGRLAFAVVRRVLGAVYEDLARMEEALRGSSAEWTVLRPPRLLDGPLTGRYERVLGGAVPRRHSIARADLAHAMLAVLDDPATAGQVVGVAG
ncbi:MAG TPA: SDR family oxidoreductase [Streptomyces sp.]|uniref:NAD(P)-dependent oxidoreductase n=1 Tax=Streptomyces sp. TaxID=1931 RepID=UPI002D45DB23|nr:SDR family oxidoreductase [Streptomyces sp.]HZG02688.1 SDR family oxidoreductase [Streptomyces sp.]